MKMHSMSTQSSNPLGLLQIGRTKAPRSGKYLQSQNTQYVLDPDLGPTLGVQWTRPGFFTGGNEVGRFVFKTDCVTIYRVPESRIKDLAQDIVRECAPIAGNTIGYGGGAIGALIRASIDITRQSIAANNESGLGVKVLGIYYDLRIADENKGFFMAVAKSEIIDEILGHFPSDKIFDYKETKKPGK